MIYTEIDKLAKKLWDYHHMNHKLKKADAIIVLCSHDVRVAKRGAELFLKRWAPLLIFTGGKGKLTANWAISEAEVFADVAIRMRVPKEKILIESKSKNTSENFELTSRLLEKKHIRIRKAILVQKPYMERRTYATCKKVWPELEIIVTSPQIAFDNYPNEEISKDDFINIMVGDLQRIKIYPEKGFQIPQEIPQDVWKAYGKLIKAGYKSHLIN